MDVKSRLEDALTDASETRGAHGVLAKHCSPSGQSASKVFVGSHAYAVSHKFTDRQ